MRNRRGMANLNQDEAYSSQFLRQIHQIEPVGRTCKGGVKPTVEVFSKHFFRDIADIQKDVHPLAALCLVAGDGIGIFDLQDVVIGYCFHFFHLSCLCRDIVVIFENGIEKLVIKIFRQCGNSLSVRCRGEF